MDRRAWSNLQVGQMPKKGSLKKSRATKRRTFKLGVFPLPTLLQIANPMEKCHYICCGPACGIPKNRLLWQKPKRHHSGRHKGSSTWYPRYPFVRGFFLTRSNGIMSLSWFKLTYNCSHDHIIVCIYIYIHQGCFRWNTRLSGNLLTALIHQGGGSRKKNQKENQAIATGEKAWKLCWDHTKRWTPRSKIKIWK